MKGEVAVESGINADVAIIGGSGLDKFASWSFAESIRSETRYGLPSAAIERYRCGARDFYFLPRHGRPHRIAPHCINYRANLYALHELGARQVVAINTVGGITPQAKTGIVVIPDQIIDYTYGREHTFYADDSSPVQHVDFTQPYSPTLRAALLCAANACDIAVLDGAVYAAVQGPRLESAAEILRLERDGCDIVGMTAMPEAALARELGIDYASLCVVVNAAAGKSSEPLTVAAMHDAMTAALADVEKIIAAFLR